MHAEHYELPPQTADAINRARERGGRVIAVGTTSCRTLESVGLTNGRVEPAEGWTDIFIYPGYTFRVIDGLLTNFHLPGKHPDHAGQRLCGIWAYHGGLPPCRSRKNTGSTASATPC